ncbi:MAG: CLI_3235 family bacteriocin precursor [Spirochaetales bacterium]|nr:CLI_3235 family bacteriocin precursor [Spirochaetales bacterium]
MKKLGKKFTSTRETIQAYFCCCDCDPSCTCNCPPFSGYQGHFGITNTVWASDLHRDNVDYSPSTL